MHECARTAARGWQQRHLQTAVCGALPPVKPGDRLHACLPPQPVRPSPAHPPLAGSHPLGAWASISASSPPMRMLLLWLAHAAHKAAACARNGRQWADFCLGHSRRSTSGSQSIPCRHPKSYAPLQREMRLTCEAPFARVCLPPHLNPPHPSHPITPSPTPPGLRRRAALCGRRGCCGCSRGSTRTRVPEAQKASQGPPLQLPPPS